MKKRWTSVVLLIFLLSACAPAATLTPTPVSASATPLPPTPTPAVLTPLPEPRIVEWAQSYFDVHYCTDGNLPLKLTIALPTHPLRVPTPLLIHAKLSSDFIRPFVERGFAVASIDWREPPNSKLPVGIEEVKCAIRFLRANASTFKIDSGSIGVFGCSRGAHMAAMIGVTDPSAEMEGEAFGFAEQSSRVQAVVMFDGIADFGTNYADALGELEDIHGIPSLDDPMVARLSPINYVTKDDPPFLLIASKDEHYQSEARILADALTVQGVSATYLQAEGANHCQWALSGPHTAEKMSTIVGDFFEENLK
ncbi:MAG: alpha/beta hydrolase fold domain-containing protein [Anaerolineales bacterium]